MSQVRLTRRSNQLSTGTETADNGGGNELYTVKKVSDFPVPSRYVTIQTLPEAVDMNGRFQMQGGKNWFLPKEMNANRFFWDSHWLEIWSNHFYPSVGPNGGSVAMDSGRE